MDPMGNTKLNPRNPVVVAMLFSQGSCFFCTRPAVRATVTTTRRWNTTPRPASRCTSSRIHWFRCMAWRMKRSPNIIRRFMGRESAKKSPYEKVFINQSWVGYIMGELVYSWCFSLGSENETWYNYDILELYTSFRSVDWWLAPGCIQFYQLIWFAYMQGMGYNHISTIKKLFWDSDWLSVPIIHTRNSHRCSPHILAAEIKATPSQLSILS